MATGFNVNNNPSGNSFMKEFNANESDNEKKKTTSGSEKKDPNMFAMIALGLGVLGLLLSFAKAKVAMAGAMVTGLLSAGALIGLMMDIKKQVKLEMPGKSDRNDGDNLFKGLDNLGDNMGVSVDFTPWFYIAIIAFLAAAFFCYKRMSSGAKTQTIV